MISEHLQLLSVIIGVGYTEAKMTFFFVWKFSLGLSFCLPFAYLKMKGQNFRPAVQE